MLTEGLTHPTKIYKDTLEEHYRATWRKKLDYLKEYPHTDPRDEVFIGPGEKQARLDHERGQGNRE